MKAFCIGRNYVEHVNELRNTVPSEPIVFIKSQSTFYSLVQNESFSPPSLIKELHYEAEIVYRFNKDISQPLQIKTTQEAHTFIDSITLGIDFTARDIQTTLKQKGLPWEKAKAFKHAALVGKWFPIQSINNVDEIHFTFYINNVCKQEGNTKHQIFALPALINHLSDYFPIKKGDYIFTGTPAGVGILPGKPHIRGIIDERTAFDIIL